MIDVSLKFRFSCCSEISVEGVARGPQNASLLKLRVSKHVTLFGVCRLI
jgi:hypothetical protein